MARDSDRDQESPSFSEGQSQDPKRPPLSHHKSDDSHNTSSDASALHTHHQHNQHRTKARQHHVGRAHGRVPSSKALHKYHQQGHSTRPPHRRNPSEPELARNQRPAPANSTVYRRSTSEVKLSQQSSAASLTKSVSHSSLKRNRSHVEVTKRTRSSDKLKRTASGTGIDLPQQKVGKSQVHFDLGDDPEDEWVDASESNSPYLSRKGSIVSSGQSSRHGESASNTRPATPNDSASPERERLNHKAYLTSRLLQRTPSQGAPPQMTPDNAQVTPAQLSPASADREAQGIVGSGEALTSRFVDGPSSGVMPAASFLHAAPANRSDNSVRRPQSEANLSRSHDEGRPSQIATEPDDSALVPRTARRSRAPPAETSRTQQKLNLQRASSVIEPGQAVSSLGVPGINPLIGSGASGYDGSQSRDPRMAKLMERTGMEYLVVRRYQNPIARSLNRLHKTPGSNVSRRIPRPNTATPNSKKSVDLPLRHSRNVSMPDPRRPDTPTNSRRPGTGVGSASGSIRRNATGHVLDGDDPGRISGSSVVDESGNGTAALLRNLWDKSTDLSASTD